MAMRTRKNGTLALLARCARWGIAASLVPTIAVAQADPRSAAFEQALRQAIAENSDIASRLQSVAPNLRAQFSIPAPSAAPPPPSAAQARAPAPASSGGSAATGGATAASSGGFSTAWAVGIGLGVAAAAGGAVAIGGGGGGGSSGSSPSGTSSGTTSAATATPSAADAIKQGTTRVTLAPISSATTEFSSQYGLGAIGVNTALSYGITGAGVNVAVIDSGVQESHPELAGVMLPGGREYFTTAAGAPNTFDADIFFGHGTHVAGTIAARRNGTGMQGVAPGARILGLAVIGSGNPVDAAINYAATYSNAGSGIKVINGSYGLDYLLGGIATPFDLAGADAATVSEGNAYMNAVARGIVVVLAAGNEGFGHAAMPAMLPLIAPANDAAAAAAQIYVNRPAGTDFSSLKSNFVAVVAVDSSRNIASFSNRCGLAKTWCIAAPGVNIKSTVDPLVLAADFDADGYETYSGTSQAAPHVTGAIALLMQMFPNLTPQQVVQLLFVTADDLGAAGVDDVYGNGLVNLTRAMGPVGTTSFKTAGGKVAMAASGVTAGSAAGDALTRAFAGKRIAVYDDLDRAFFVDLGQFARAAKSTFNVDLAFDRFARMADRAQVQLGESMTLSFRVRDASVLDDRDAAFRARAEQDGRPDGTKVKAKFSEMTVERRLGDGASVTFGLNADINRFVGHFARNEDLADMRVGTAFASPFLSFVQDGYAAGSAARLGAAASFRVAAFSGERADGFGTARSDGFVSELTVGSGRLSLGLQSGLLDERNRVLGGYGTGAFSLGDSAATAFVGALADLRMSDSLSLLASYQAGWTRAVGSGSSLLRASGLIRSDSFSLGLVGRGLLRRDDWLSLSLSQPLRVASGKADVDMALGYDSAGNPVSARFTADLAPSGRELEVELAHGFAWGAATRVSAGIMLRIEPDHVRSAPAEGLALFKLRHAF